MPWPSYLADDYQLGNMVHRAGWQIALDPCFVESVIKPENLMTVLSRQLRWARTMRVSRPGGYLASGITLPFPAALLASLLAPTPAIGLAAVALLYGVRLTVSTHLQPPLCPGQSLSPLALAGAAAGYARLFHLGTLIPRQQG